MSLFRMLIVQEVTGKMAGVNIEDIAIIRHIPAIERVGAVYKRGEDCTGIVLKVSPYPGAFPLPYTVECTEPVEEIIEKLKEALSR